MDRRFQSWVTLFLCLLLAACATAPALRADQSILHDQLFAAPTNAINAEEVFALSEPMRHYLKVEIAQQLRSKGLQRGLFDALSQKDQIKIEYDAEITKTAAQTFATRSGNCLSLVIMTAALARELHMEVQYQHVLVDDAWSRSNDIYFASNHVNIVLGKKLNFLRQSYDQAASLVIDFLPPVEIGAQHTKPLEEKTILAMYMNNRAAELLARDKLDDAYWYARESIRQDPVYASGQNTLGVIYLRHGDILLAEQVFRQILQNEPGNLTAMSNLVEVLDNHGRSAEAKILQSRLEQLQPYPPFHFFKQAMAALLRGELKEAKSLLRREMRRDPDYHEFHFWLAVIHFKLDEMEQARDQLLIARANSTTRSKFDLYSAKLEHLKAVQTH